jgi:4-hydroxy-tetrahydrodipicolinate synthase
MFSSSIVALVTPFNEENTIDFNTLAELIEWHISAGTQGIVLAGTTGESATLSFDEKLAIAKFAVDIAQKRIQIILGNGSNNTAEVIALTEQANSIALDGYLTVTPYYNKPTQQGLIAHYRTIAEVSSHPIILYNVPSRTCCDMVNETVLTLAELPNIVALKDATADLSRLSALKQQKPPSFALLSGDDATAVSYCLQGGDGVISVSANVVPGYIAQIQQAIANNQLDEAKRLNALLMALHRDLFVESNPIAVKWAMKQLNKLACERVRLPLTPLSLAAQQKLQQTMQAVGLL